MAGFLNKDSWSQKERGWEYECALFYPSDTKETTIFFIPNSENPNNGTIVKNIRDFSPDFLKGRPKAKEQKVVFTIKPRRVVIISGDNFNQSKDYEYILVASINTIKEAEKKRSWYSRLIKDEHPIYTFLPSNSIERYVDLSQVTSIHKSLLLSKKIKLTENRLEVLEQTLLECLSLGIVEEDYVGEVESERV